MGREADVALRSSLRHELEEAGFAPSATRFYRPSLGLVSRSSLVAQVQARRGDIVVVTAPAGYGKSTLLTQLADEDPRPSAWITLTAADDDPAVLLADIALALDEVEPVDARPVTASFVQPPTIGSLALQQFGAMFAGRRTPFVLVLDDVHELAGRDALDVLPELTTHLPAGSTILLGARTAIPLPLGRLRVRRRVVELGPADLAFDGSEAAELFRALRIDVGPEEIGRLVERTEGWPVALYLAALAAGDGRGAVASVLESFSGDQRYIVEYLGEELLDGLQPDEASFLMEAACLDRFSGRMCDEVLDRHGSAELLEDLRRRNQLIIPLDDRRDWYRFHHLLAEFLAAELGRRDHRRRDLVHRRASEWCDMHGDGDGAVTQAARGNDLPRMEAMVMRWFGPVGGAARLYPTMAHWLELVPDHELSASPLLMVIAAWSLFGAGQPGSALQWLARATEVLRPDLHRDDAQGPVPPVALAMAKAIVAPLPPEAMLEEATYAYEHVGVTTGFPMSCLARGAAAFMLGDEAEARLRLREGADNPFRNAIPTANSLAHLAAIDIEHGRWAEATATAREARQLAGETATAPYSVFVLSVSVVVEAHAGTGKDVEIERVLCRQYLAGFAGVAPWLNLQTRVALARAAMICGDHAEATALIEEAEAILEAMPSAVGVAQQLAGLRREAVPHDKSNTLGPSSLTTAELRVLRYLPTHLSIPEIADRLYVSRNTVKSQTIAIYRKLGTSSRTGAVESAIAAGLLPDPRHS